MNRNLGEYDGDEDDEDASDSDVDDVSDSGEDSDEGEMTCGDPDIDATDVLMDSRMPADRRSIKGLLSRLEQLNARWH